MKPDLFLWISSLLLAGALVGVPDSAEGQEFMTLETPPDPRSEAMGRFPFGLTGSSFAAWGHVAGLGFSSGIHLSGSRHEVYPDLADGMVHSYGSLSVGRPMGAGLRLGLEVSIADFRIPATGDLSPYDCLPVGDVGPHERTYSLSGALGFRETIALGVRVKWLKGQLSQPCRDFDPSIHYRSRPIYDVGLQSRISLGSRDSKDRGMVLIGGLTVANLGPDIEGPLGSTSPLPRAARAAVGIEARRGTVAEIGLPSGGVLFGHAPLITLALDFGIERTFDQEWSNLTGDSLATASFLARHQLSAGGGVEVALLRTLFLRTGYLRDDLRWIKGWTWGLGLGFAGVVGLDYAGVPQFPELDSLNMISLRVRWPRGVDPW